MHGRDAPQLRICTQVRVNARNSQGSLSTHSAPGTVLNTLHVAPLAPGSPRGPAPWSHSGIPIPGFTLPTDQPPPQAPKTALQKTTLSLEIRLPTFKFLLWESHFHPRIPLLSPPPPWNHPLHLAVSSEGPPLYLSKLPSVALNRFDNWVVLNTSFVMRIKQLDTPTGPKRHESTSFSENGQQVIPNYQILKEQRQHLWLRGAAHPSWARTKESI